MGFQDFPANDQVYTNPTGINLPESFGIPGVPTTILPCITFNGTACNGGTYTSLGSTDGVEIFHDTTIEVEDVVDLDARQPRHSLRRGISFTTS